MRLLAVSTRRGWTAMRAIGRGFVDTVGPAFEAFSNMCFIPGVYLRIAIRGLAFKLVGVPVIFGPATSGRSRGVFSDDERAATQASKALVRSGIVQTALGLAILLPEILRQVLLDAPTFTPSYDDGTVIEFIIDRWLRDWPRGLTAWLGISAILMAPLSGDEWTTVRRGMQERRSTVASGVLAAIARLLTRILEPLDALGRLSIGALWIGATVWLLIQAVHIGSVLLL